LDGTTWRFPGGLEGTCQTVLLAYTRKQSKDLDTWRPKLKAMGETHPGHRGYEVPLVPVSKWLQGIIRSGMRGGVDDPVQKKFTVPLFIDPEPVNKDLGITSEETVQIVLVSGGTPRWKGPAVAASEDAWRAAAKTWCATP